MDKTALLREFASLGEVPINLTGFLFDLALAVGLSWLLGKCYVTFGRTFSNRETFSRNFVPVALATMFLITVVKSSLALSLGLVGALSIVRFRAAIKEPEELSYLFLAIAIGVGLGAGQRPLTLVAFTVVMAVMVILRPRETALENRGMFLTLSSDKASEKGAEEIAAVLAVHCTRLKLRRWDEKADRFEAAFLAQFKDFEAFRRGKDALLNLDPGLRVGLMDAEGLI